MSAQTVSYCIDPHTTAVVGVDFQIAFGSFEPVPGAERALENFRRAASAWRAAGGQVIQVHMAYTPDRGPAGRMTDFAPEAAQMLSEGTEATAFYDGIVEPKDILVRKNLFSAVMGSDLLEQLHARELDTVVIGGLTTPICVQSTVDGLSMSGIKVVVLEDACASQPIGTLTARDAHVAAIQRMGYLFGQILSTQEFLATVADLTSANEASV